MPLPHVERRYLIVPGLRSSRIHVIDTKPDPKNLTIVRVIQPAEIADRTGYSAAF
jgi:selenium-binding protein 1